MTATYDGHLTVNPKQKVIGACCRAMDEAVMRGQFYVSQRGLLTLRRGDNPSKGSPCVSCPFCGARVGEAPVEVFHALSDSAPKGRSLTEILLSGDTAVRVATGADGFRYLRTLRIAPTTSLLMDEEGKVAEVCVSDLTTEWEVPG